MSSKITAEIVLLFGISISEREGGHLKMPDSGRKSHSLHVGFGRIQP